MREALHTACAGDTTHRTHARPGVAIGLRCDLLLLFFLRSRPRAASSVRPGAGRVSFHVRRVTGSALRSGLGRSGVFGVRAFRRALGSVRWGRVSLGFPFCKSCGAGRDKARLPSTVPPRHFGALASLGGPHVSDTDGTRTRDRRGAGAETRATRPHPTHRSQHAARGAGGGAGSRAHAHAARAR